MLGRFLRAMIPYVWGGLLSLTDAMGDDHYEDGSEMDASADEAIRWQSAKPGVLSGPRSISEE